MRLIDADALKRELAPVLAWDWNNGAYVRETIDAMPTVNAMPVVRARWEDAGKGLLRCSNCRDCHIWEDYVEGRKWRYCPQCGARLKGDD